MSRDRVLGKRPTVYRLSLAACYNCCHTFENKAVSIPYGPSRYGNFCSYSCALSYLFPHEPRGVGDAQLLNLECLLETGKNIVRSPPILSLKLFGGPLGIEEYRSNNNSSYYDLSYDSNGYYLTCYATRY